MQQLLTSVRARRGFTMVELLVALVLLGLVSAALYRVLVNNQRLYTAQTQRIDLSQNIRAAANILPAEFRQLDASDAAAASDIVAMSADSITIHALRWTSFVCVAPVLNGAGAGRQMVIRGTQPGDPMFFGSRGVQLGVDSMMVYLDGNQTTRLDDYYVPAKITAVTPAGAALCPAIPGAGATAGTTVSWDGNFYVPASNVANAIPVGAPVWGFERVTYKLFQAGDGLWYIGYRPWLPAGTAMQPIIGPVLPNGLTFSYFDSTGAATALRTRVARIDITVRARTAMAVRNGGTAPAQTIVDSIVTSVALRNNRRF